MVYARQGTDELKVSFLDVGQGDAIFIESPTGNRVLIDGGPTRKVLSELGGVLPFGDKRIDVVISTHPDADHITGLVEVVKRFDVGVFIEPGVNSENNLDEALSEILLEKGVEKILARKGVNLSLGGGAVLSILFPNSDVTNLETNEASIVGKLVYGEKSFLLTGDATKRTEYILLNLGQEFLDVDVLQVGHHGSQTSTSQLFVEATSPQISVISSGKNNRYGHPHPSVVETLNKFGTQILNTAEVGTISFETDGETLEVR